MTIVDCIKSEWCHLLPSKVSIRIPVSIVYQHFGLAIGIRAWRVLDILNSNYTFCIWARPCFWAFSRSHIWCSWSLTMEMSESEPLLHAGNQWYKTRNLRSCSTKNVTSPRSPKSDNKKCEAKHVFLMITLIRVTNCILTCSLDPWSWDRFSIARSSSAGTRWLYSKFSFYMFSSGILKTFLSAERACSTDYWPSFNRTGHNCLGSPIFWKDSSVVCVTSGSGRLPNIFPVLMTQSKLVLRT